MIEIVEVGPRDGYQGIIPFIPTATKLTFLRRLVSAGLERIEVGSLVSSKAVPQLVDTPSILAACNEIPGIVPQVLVPSKKYGLLAVKSGAKFVAFVISVSEAHNRSNVNRHPMESAKEYQELLGAMPLHVEVRLNIATAFDCPFEGRVDDAATIALLDMLVRLRPDVEICLCDTTGRASPDHVEHLFETAVARFPQVGRWAMHAHDTYGLGLANVYAAYRRGIRTFDSSFAGLGGCPFAPGATGNVATEDIVWLFARMGERVSIDLDALIPIANDGAAIQGGLPGGRVRAAMRARAARTVECG